MSYHVPALSRFPAFDIEGSGRIHRANPHVPMATVVRPGLATARFTMNAKRLGRVLLGGYRVTNASFDSVHTASVFNVVLPQSGRLTQRVGGRSWDLNGPDPGAIQSASERSTSATRTSIGLLMWIGVGDLSHGIADLEGTLGAESVIDMLHSKPDVPGMMALREVVLTVARRLDDPDDLFLDKEAYLSALDEILLLSAAALVVGQGQLRPKAPAAGYRLRRAKEFIVAHISEAISLTELARSVGVSIRTVQNDFRSAHGVTVGDFILGKRFERARAMIALAQPHETVTSIALACGFNHLGAFAGGYKARFGERPSEALARSKSPVH